MIKNYIILFFITTQIVCCEPYYETYSRLNKSTFNRDTFSIKNNIKLELKKVACIKNKMESNHQLKSVVTIVKKLGNNPSVKKVLKAKLEINQFKLNKSIKILSCFLYFKRFKIREDLKALRVKKNKYITLKKCEEITKKIYIKIINNPKRLGGEALKALWFWNEKEKQYGLSNIHFDIDKNKIVVYHKHTIF